MPVVTTDGQADIVCDGVGLRQLSDDTWDEVGRLISSDHDFDGAAELCQYVFFQIFGAARGPASLRARVSPRLGAL